MDLNAISGPDQTDQPYTPVVRDGTGAVIDSGALVLKDDSSPFETMYKWDVQDRVTISPEARRRYRDHIAGF